MSGRDVLGHGIVVYVQPLKSERKNIFYYCSRLVAQYKISLYMM